MKRLAIAVLPGLIMLLGACASTPRQPADLARFDRDMQKAAEYLQEGRMRQAADKYRVAANRALLFDDPARIALAELGRGAVSIELRELEQAKSHYRYAEAESRRATRNDLTAQATLGIAEVSRQEGDCDSALAMAEPLRESPDRTLRLSADLLTAHCLRAVGDAPAATALLESLGAEIESAPGALRSAWHATRATSHLAAGALDAAMKEAEMALAIDRERRYPPAIAADHRLLAEIHLAAGANTEAGHHQERAERISILSGLRDAPAPGRH
jgi:tetratricopeptide (TPR) repeat protein